MTEISKYVDCEKEILLIKTDGINPEIHILKNCLNPKIMIIFEKFSNFLNIDRKIIGEKVIIDTNDFTIKQSERSMQQPIYKIAKEFDIDLDQPKYGCGVGHINGTYQKYHISCLEVSGGKFVEYIIFIYDGDKHIKTIVYKNGFTSIFDQDGKLEREYDDIKFDFMLFPSVNQ